MLNPVLNHAARSVIFGQRQTEPNLPVLLSLDIDDSLLGRTGADQKTFHLPGLETAVDIIRRAKAQVQVMLNTARSIDLMKPLLAEGDPVADIFRELPVRYMCLNTGQELYVNSDDHPLESWLGKLEITDQNADWAAILRQRFGWGLNNFKETVRTVFKEAGFRVNADVPWQQNMTSEFTRTDGGCLLDLRPEFSSSYRAVFFTPHDQLTEAQEAFVQAMVQRVRTRLLEQGVETRQVRYQRVDQSYPQGKAIVVIYKIVPTGIHKQLPIQHVLDNHAPVRAVISAGDRDDDDATMLEPRHYELPNGSSIANYPIQVGHNADLSTRLMAHPERVKTSEGELGPALLKQFKKLDIQL